MKKIYLLLAFPLAVCGQTINTSFGNNGTATTDIAYGGESFGGMAISPAGSVYLFGSSASGTNPLLRGVGIVKFNADGGVDESFGDHGKIIHTIDSYQNIEPYAMVIQPDGKMVVAGRTGHKNVVMRILPDGNLDPDFAMNGVHVLDSDYIRDLFLGPDSKIYITGIKGLDGSLERLNTNGLYDTGFGVAGIALFDEGFANESLQTGKVLDDGSILCFGQSNDPAFPGNRVVFLKYSSAGVLDTSFGKRRIPLGTYDQHITVWDFELLADNSMIVLLRGSYFAPPVSFYNSRIYKIDMTGSPVTGFASNGFYPLGADSVWPRDVAAMSNGNLMIATMVEGDSNSALNAQFFSPAGAAIPASVVSVSVPTNSSSRRSKTLIHNDHLYVGYDKDNNGTNDLFVNGYNLSSALSLVEHNVQEVKVYPNPVTDQVTIALNSMSSDVSIDIYSITGSLLATVTEHEVTADSQLWKANLSQFPTGMYFFRVTLDGATTTYKVIKK
ncbi:MAG TPA: T9SS type A sorting domain-containing protein [Flavobacterium sp.]|jgi:uncharacterized delta-60 repeat protein